jgi:uncharacterized protein with HEPN domain
LPFEDPRPALQDILEAIEQIAHFTQGQDQDAFLADLKTIAAANANYLVDA